MIIRQTILVNIVLLNIWLWIANNILHIFKYKTKIVTQIIIYSAIGVGALSIYPLILQRVNLENLTIQQNASKMSIAIFIIYIITAVSVLWKTREDKRKLQNISIMYFLVTVIAWVMIAQGNINIWWAVLFFFLAAFAEELIKRMISYKNYNQHCIAKKDLIIFWLLVGLGFSFRENIVLWLETNNALIRTPMYIVHATLTCIIASSVMAKEKYTKLVLWITIATTIILHATYNLTHNKISSIWIIGIWLIVYFCLSHFLYQSDSQYINKEKTW